MAIKPLFLHVIIKSACENWRLLVPRSRFTSSHTTVKARRTSAFSSHWHMPPTQSTSAFPLLCSLML